MMHSDGVGITYTVLQFQKLLSRYKLASFWLWQEVIISIGRIDKTGHPI